MKTLPSVDSPKTRREQAAPVPAVVGEVAGYIPRNVDVRMTLRQATILRDKLRTLQDAGAKTADGRYVTNRAQAVRWILENEVQVR